MSRLQGVTRTCRRSSSRELWKTVGPLVRALENGSDAHDLAQGNGRRLAAEGLRTVCLQHEIDHLDGILFIDRISGLKRGMNVRRREKQLLAEREEGVKRAHGRGL